MTTNLSGSLSEFSLAEVLSLLGMGGRTARMQVTSATAVGTVHLVDGRISSATALPRGASRSPGFVQNWPPPRVSEPSHPATRVAASADPLGVTTTGLTLPSSP